MKIFKRQVLILTATVFKMPVSRRGKRRTLEKANGNETGEELNKKKKKIGKERERHFHDTSQSSFTFILNGNPQSLVRSLFADGETEAPRVRDVPGLSWFIRG